MLELDSIRERFRQSLWFLPAIFATAAVALALVLVTVDRQLARDGMFFVFGGTAEGARSVLSTIAQSMLTFTGLVFTITMLVLQLASSQLSPRVMRTFLRDRQNQVVLGLFVATFLFTLLVLREVRGGDDDDQFVPGLSIWVAFILLVASVGAFILYIDHMAQSIRASSVIDSIGRESRQSLDRLYPEGVGREPVDDPLPNRPPPDRTIPSTAQGSIVGIDEDAFLDAAQEHDVLLELVPAVGDYVPIGAPLVHVWGDADEGIEGTLRRHVAFARERTLRQDLAFGFRQLVDIGNRALSPGINDPTTAVQALDQIHDMLRGLATREFPSPIRVDDTGRPRLILHRPEWVDYVHLAVDEIRLAARDSLQVLRRLRTILEDLLEVAPEERRGVLRQQLELLDRAVERRLEDAADRYTASLPSSRSHHSPQ